MGHQVLNCDNCGTYVMESRNSWKCDNCGFVCDKSTNWEWKNMNKQQLIDKYTKAFDNLFSLPYTVSDNEWNYLYQTLKAEFMNELQASDLTFSEEDEVESVVLDHGNN